MPINIGNSSLREVYAGSTAIKKIYAGSNLVWSKSSGSSLILTLDTSNVTQDLQGTGWYIQVEVYSRSIDDYTYMSIYLDKTKKVDEGLLEYHFSNNQFIYSDVSDGDEVTFWLVSDSGEEPDIHIECNGEDIYNGPVFTIDGQTTVALVVTDKPSDLILTLDTSYVENDLSSHYVMLCVNGVNGDYRDKMIYLNEGEGDDYFSNNQFIYSDVSDGDEVSIVLVSDGPYPNVLFYDNESDTKKVTINGQTDVTLKIVDRYVDNIVEIPYEAIQTAFGNIFYDDYYAKLTVKFELSRYYGSDKYTKTYTYTGEDYANNSDIIAYDGEVNIVDFLYPDATWSISYYKPTDAESVEETGSISFSETEDCHFVGTFD